MGKIIVKNLPRLKLSDLLKRRTTTLDEFMKEHGITTYTDLDIFCKRLGVVPPTLEEFSSVRTGFVNSPAEGVIIVEPDFTFMDVSVTNKTKPTLNDDSTFVDDDDKVMSSSESHSTVVEPTECPQKKSRKKKE